MDNATAVAYANSTVKCSKIQNIDTWQDWVSAMHNSEICRLWKVDTKENESDLLMKIHEVDQFERLRDRCMVLQAILTGQPTGTLEGSSLQRQHLRRQQGICAQQGSILSQNLPEQI